MDRTLLYTVQRILEKLDLDSVNSINDSEDAILIARECEDTYYDLISRHDWPEREDLLKVESVGKTDLPTALRLPENVIKVTSVRYDVTTEDDEDQVIKVIEYVEPEEFLSRSYSRNTSDANVLVSDYNDIPLYVKTDEMPSYYTTFDNEYLIFDSVDRNEETTLQGSNTIVRGVSVPVWYQDDDFVIPVDVVTFPLYLAEASAACSQHIAGIPSPEEERRRSRGISRLRREASRLGLRVDKNKFGRVGNGRT